MKTNKCAYVLLVSLAMLSLCSGCAFSGRRVLLKEYAPTVPPNAGSPLKGVAVCVKPFKSTFSIDDKLGDKNTSEPAGYAYIKMTPEQEKQWDKDRQAREATSKKEDWLRIGYVRNGLGMVGSYVYSVNDPGQWLAETLRMDLQSQGASLVDPAQEDSATVTVTGSITLFKIDIYMKYWADLIVDLEITPKGKSPIHRIVHTAAGQTAWSSSGFEYYQSIRQCQQKLSRTLLGELEKLVSQ